MKIGMIGAGFIGQALALLCVKNGHTVMLSNSRGPDTLATKIAEIGCLAGTAQEAAIFGDVVVLTVPFHSYRAAPVAPLSGKVVIDTCNYYPNRDGTIAALEERLTTTSEMVAEHLSGARIVKAFNAILAKDLDVDVQLPGFSGRRALPIAGNDAEAKAIVTHLHQQFGFHVVDAGMLSESWRFERAKPAYCIPLDCAGLIKQLAVAERNHELPEGSWRR
jgi:predicted dinucleotide-binding enzyme